MRKRFLILAIIALVLAISTRLYFRLTDDFRISNITYDLPHRSDWDIAHDPSQLPAILQQSFRYIGKGSQSYAFASADDQYVLKFFKYKHLRPHWLVTTLSPLPYFNDYHDKQLKRKARKLEHLFAGYHLAWEQLREESGLIFIHLNQTQNRYPEVTLIDKIGLTRHVDLDSVVFIIQKKAITTRTVIDTLLANQDLQGAKQRLRQILALYASEYKRGLYDMDHGVMHNTGFVGDQPIHLDIGKLTREPRTLNADFYQEDIEKVIVRIESWLKNSYPQYHEEISKDLRQATQELFGIPA